MLFMRLFSTAGAERLTANGLELVTRAYSWDASSRRIMRAVAALDLGE